MKLEILPVFPRPKVRGRDATNPAAPRDLGCHETKRIAEADAPGGYQNAWVVRKVERAFTLLEVMIACGIFFIAVFAILALVSNTLRNAQRLRRVEVDAGMVAAQLFKTNRLTEGKDSGNFGDVYPDYTWDTDTEEAFPFTNGLWQVDITIWKRGRHEPFDQMSVWVYSPDSRSSALGRR